MKNRDEIVLSNGIRMATRLNHVGFAWLQEHYAEPLAAVTRQWDESGLAEDDAILVFSALVVQVNPGMSEAEAREALASTSRTKLLVDLLRHGVGIDVSQCHPQTNEHRRMRA